ncbi:ras family-domain-containing protein [Russula aff. rugulosa BPL654]|nr:ras family-domain-containing protein [Russula aff. rugulosa BPL654]
MSIWDTAGQEHFCRAPYSDLMYDVSNRESFEALSRWLEELENYVPPEVVKIVVGNKLDEEYSRQVPTSEGATFAARMGCLFVEASAKTAVGVQRGHHVHHRYVAVEMRINPSRPEEPPPPPTPPVLVDRAESIPGN